MNHSQIVAFIWGVADLIRDAFKRGKYQDVILPLTVLRRLDCVLAPTKEKVLAEEAKWKAKGLKNRDERLRKASGYAFYNISKYDFDKLLGDAPNLKSNLLNYISGFSPNMQEVLDRFDFSNTIAKLDEAGLLFKVVERFKGVDLHPEIVDNTTMGTIFEELIRKFNEALNENPGEHFTPRDVVRLMVELLLAGDREKVTMPGAVVTICDPCAGSGGMLTIAKDLINGTNETPGINPGADVFLFGQEVNPETYAICKSDLFMKSADGRDGENIAFGSTLAADKHAGRRFDYLIANPPYGKDWKGDEDAVRAEGDKGPAGRFPAGLPRISDGQLLFFQHMLSRVAAPEDGGGRVAIIMNGSPLFTGDAGSGESEIRRWVLENDWLDAIIALPEQLFYNTGIATYVWMLTNRKLPERKGKVQLIDATRFWSPGAAADNRRSLGDKRRHVPDDKRAEILSLYNDFTESDVSKIFDTETFGYRKITVERPLRLNFQASPERIARLDDQTAFKNLAISKKKDPKIKGKAEEEGRALQNEIRAFLGSLPDTLQKDGAEFASMLDATLKEAGLKLSASVKKAVLAALVLRGCKEVPMKDSGVDWMGQVPEHWAIRRIKHVARLASGHTPSRREPLYWTDRTIPWFQLTDIWQFRDDSKEVIEETAEMVSELGVKHSSAELLPAGTVALSRTASVGFSAILGVDMATTQDFANWIPGPPVRSAYLLYVLRAMRPEFQRLRFGSTHKTIYMRDIGKFVMPLPPLEEQDLIVESIRAEARILLGARGKLQEAIAYLEEYRSALISAAVSGEIDVGEAA